MQTPVDDAGMAVRQRQAGHCEGYTKVGSSANPPSQMGSIFVQCYSKR